MFAILIKGKWWKVPPREGHATPVTLMDVPWSISLAHGADIIYDMDTGTCLKGWPHPDLGCIPVMQGFTPETGPR